MSYLFAAYCAIWVILFVYVFTIRSRQANLEKAVESLSRRLEKGSRLLVTLDVDKNAFAEINYGTGKDVSLEDVNDAKVPLEIKWQTDSFVNIPIREYARR